MSFIPHEVSSPDNSKEQGGDLLLLMLLLLLLLPEVWFSVSSIQY